MTAYGHITSQQILVVQSIPENVVDTYKLDYYPYLMLPGYLWVKILTLKNSISFYHKSFLCFTPSK